MTICNITGYACDCQPDEGIPCDGLGKIREACESWKKQSIDRGQEINQLRANLSLAEEGLANYEEEAQACIRIKAEKDTEIARLKEGLARIKELSDGKSIAWTLAYEALNNRPYSFSVPTEAK